MRIRTMLNRKMKLIWEEQGHWLVSAPPVFPLTSSAVRQGREMGEPEETGLFPLEHDLLPSMHHEGMPAFYKNT